MNTPSSPGVGNPQAYEKKRSRWQRGVLPFLREKTKSRRASCDQAVADDVRPALAGRFLDRIDVATGPSAH